MAMAFKGFFVVERARALMQMLLTRHEDLEIKEARQDGALDYFISVRREGAYDGCQIALVIKAAMSFAADAETKSQLREAAERVHNIGSCNFPVALFFFTAKDDRGYFAWVWEPEIDENGAPKLVFQPNPSLRDLNDKSLNETIETASIWYDAVHAALIS